MIFMTTKEKILAIEVLSNVLQSSTIPVFQQDDFKGGPAIIEVFDEIDTGIIRSKLMELVGSLKVEDPSTKINHFIDPNGEI